MARTKLFKAVADTNTDPLAVFHTDDRAEGCWKIGLNLPKTHKVDDHKNIEGETDLSNRHSDLMWPILFLLKFLGNCPLSLVESEGWTQPFAEAGDCNENKMADWRSQVTNSQSLVKKVKIYKIQCKSLSFILSTVLALILSSHWIILGLEAGTSWDAPHAILEQVHEVLDRTFGKESPIGKLGSKPFLVAIQLSIILTSALQVFELLCCWAESIPLAKFLNQWTCCEREFEATFPNHHRISSRDSHQKLYRIRNLLLLFYVGLPTVIFIPLFVAANDEIEPLLFRIIFTFPMGIHFSAVSLLEDVKSIMIYRILSEAYRKMRAGMIYSLKFEKLTAEKMKKWRLLIHSLRLQVTLAGESQKCHQLLLIGGSILMTTCYVFILLNGPWGKENTWRICLVITSCLLFQISRLFFKTLVASYITLEESLIAQELVTINSDNDSKIEYEVKFIHDMIMQSPAVISFGSYVTLNKQLILHVFSHVVSYIIVLMQLSH